MIAYLDAPSGISGDMFLGCLLDAGWPVEKLRDLVHRLKLPASEWSVDAKAILKGPVRATLADVRAVEGSHHRHLSDIRAIINAADIPEAVKQKAIAVFTRLAAAEAKVHGTSLEEVHFHEVGAVDAIIDIVGVVAGLHELGITELYSSPLPMGSGWVKVAHGRIPLPAPATLEILADAQVPTVPAPGPGELVTPTGAALVAELARFGQPAMQISRIATGAGQRECEWPNVARLWLGHSSQQAALVILETNIDDMNPQLYAPVIEKLLTAGAKDAWLTPIQMKKGRPATMLSVLAPASAEDVISELILRETTTLGVRVVPITRRHEADREFTTVRTEYGDVRAKMKILKGKPIGISPEYDDCVSLAEKSDLPVRIIYEKAMLAAQQFIAEQSHIQNNATPKPASWRPLIFINTIDKITDK